MDNYDMAEKPTQMTWSCVARQSISVSIKCKGTY